MTRKRPRGADEPSGAWNAAGIVVSEVLCTLPVLSGSTAIAVVLGDAIMEKSYRGDARQWWRRLVSNVAPPRLVLPQYCTALLPSPTRSNVFQHFAASPRYCLSQDPTFCNVLWSCLATPLIPIPTDLMFCSVLWPCLGTASHGCPGGCLGTTLVSIRYRLPQDPTFCSILWSRLGIASRRVPRFQHSVVPPRSRMGNASQRI